jgi:hypothetical protein
MKLVLILGVWMNINSVSFLEDRLDGCVVYFNSPVAKRIKGHGCGEVAQAINEALEKR